MIGMFFFLFYVIGYAGTHGCERVRGASGVMKREKKIGTQGHKHRTIVGIRHGREASRRGGRWEGMRN